MTEQMYGQLVKKVANISALFKEVCGIGNNASWFVVRYAIDQMKSCGFYNQQVKKAVNNTTREWHDYEHRLIYAKENRMFHLADMEEKTRRRYGDITDRQYYDFWASIGSTAYIKTKPFITSLWNKYRLSLLNHHIGNADEIAWMLTATASLGIAMRMYADTRQNSIDMVCDFLCTEDIRQRTDKEAMHYKAMSVSRAVNIINGVFSQFSLERMGKSWDHVVNIIISRYPHFELDEVETRNISLGVEQLREAWLDPSLIYHSISESVNDFDDIFATDGFRKKALREIADIQSKEEEELNKQRQ